MATLPIDVAGSDETYDTLQIESPDYTDYELLNVGIYTNPSRTVTVERRTDKNGKPFVMARLEFAELTNEEGTNTFLRKPLVRYVFSFTRKQKNKQGETSDISEYLKAVGITLGGSVDIAQLLAALGESGAYPVRIKVDWTNRTPKVGEEYLPEKAYTSDFNKGSNGTSHFVPRITSEDVAALPVGKAKERLSLVLFNGMIQAKHKVGAFYKI